MAFNLFGPKQDAPAPTQQGVDTRRRLAEALMRVQMPQGQQAGRFYVAPSPWAQLASGVANVAGQWQMGKADKEQKTVDDDWNAKFTEALMKGGADPAAVQSASMLPKEQKQALLGQITATKLAPKPASSRAPVVVIGPDGKPQYSNAEDAIGKQPYEKDESGPLVPFVGPDGKPQYGTREEARGKAPYSPPPSAPTVNVSTNTEKGLYGTLAEQQGKQYSDLYSRAQSAPERIDRAARVRGLLADGAITGAGANQKLAIARGLKSLGLYDTEDIANTELLGRELAGSTLEAIKSSGLGSGSGFTNADRDFLEKVAGGQVTQDAQTLQRIAELNDRAARAEIGRWNDLAGRLQPEQLKTLGMQRIELPTALPQTSGKPNDVSQVLQQLQIDPKYQRFFQQQ